MNMFERVALVLEEGYLEVKITRHRLGLFGTIDGDLITVDIRQDDPVTTLIHEVLHWLYPNASEEWVEKRAVLTRGRLRTWQYNYLRSFIIDDREEKLRNAHPEVHPEHLGEE